MASSSSSSSSSSEAATFDAQALASWQAEEERAIAALPLIARLYTQHHVILDVFSRNLINADAIALIKLHRFSKHLLGEAPLRVADTLPLIEAIYAMRDSLSPCRIDVARALLSLRALPKPLPTSTFLHRLLEPLAASSNRRSLLDAPQDVVLYGFGRIGRLVARLLIEKTATGLNLRLRAVVVRSLELEKRASLLRRDSIFGAFHGAIDLAHERRSLIINGQRVQFIESKGKPSSIDYTVYGISNAIVVDNTGAFRDRKSLGEHVQAPGVSKVLLTAPGKGDVPNLVYGINHAAYNAGECVFSAASCTTNAVVPILFALDRRFGPLEHVHIETVHSFTNDQNLVDNIHEKSRRGRAAPLNIVIAETGAAEAVARVLPQLDGRLSANAIRVPTPNVSLAIIHVTIAEPLSGSDDVNVFLRRVALESSLSTIIDFTNSPSIVSSDVVGSRYACVIDGQATQQNGRRFTIYAYYDNECGYSAQVFRLVRKLAGINLPTFPERREVEDLVREVAAV